MTIALRAAGAATAQSDAVTAINPAVPTGTTTGDLSVLSVWVKPYDTTLTTPSGWTKIGEATNGTTAAGTDTGSTKVAMYVRESATPGAIPAIGQTGANAMGAVINSYSKTTGTWDFTASTSGGDATNAANYSATGAAGISVATDDWVLASTAVNGDVGTLSAFALDGMSGATLGTYVDRQSAPVTAGMDARGVVGDIPITAGSSTAAPTFTYTNASSGSGTTMWLRLRLTPDAITVEKTSETLWTVKATVEKTSETNWDIAGPSAWSSIFSMTTLVVVEKTSVSSWDVKTGVQKTSETGWVVKAAVEKTSATNWAVVRPVEKTIETSWGVIATIEKTQASSWSVKTAIEKTSESSWAVRTPVDKTSAITWSVLASVTQSLPTSWNVSTVVTQIVLTNLVSNPHVGTNATYYSPSVGVGGTATLTRPTTGGPDGGAFVRATWTVAGTAVTSGIRYGLSGIDPNLLVSPGEYLSARFWVRSSIVQRMVLYVQYLNAAGGNIRSTISAQVVLAANVWTEIVFNQVVVAPALTAKAQILAYSNSGTSGVVWPVGATLDLALVSANKGQTAQPYFDGDTPDVPGGFTYAWTGTAHASTSIGSVVVPRTLATSWDVDEQVTSSMETLWNVEPALFTATQTVDTSWGMAQSITQSISTSWDGRASVTQSMGTTYDVRSLITQSLSTTYDVRSLVLLTLAIQWDVQQGVTASTSTSWNVLVRIDQSLDLGWNVFEQTEMILDLAWDVAEEVTLGRETTWDTLEQVEADLEVLWDILTSVLQTLVTTYNMASDLIVIWINEVEIPVHLSMMSLGTETPAILVIL